METKLAMLKRKVLSNFEERIDELLSLCESPIERLFMLYLLQHCTKWKSKFENPRFCFESLEFINGWNKIAGIKIKGQMEIRTTRIIIPELDIYLQKEVEFQESKVRIDVALILSRYDQGSVFDLFKSLSKNSNVISKNSNNITIKKDLIDTRKIAIECDGHAFHSTKEQKERDDRRSRKLQAAGWKVLRYSGSELNGINSDEEFQNVFAEIMEVFYAI